MKHIIVIFLFGSIGCSSIPGMPGYVNSYESKADGSKHIDVIPGQLDQSGVRLGLHQSSELKDSVALVIVDQDTVRSKDGLLINIDGEKSTFSSIDDLSDLHSDGFRKRFILKLDYLRKMVLGKSVWIKISYNGQAYSEGEFSRQFPTSAKDAFINFLKEVDKSKPQTKN